MSIGIGEVLQGAREQLGRSVEDAAQQTRMRSDYIRALENEQFEVFGGDVYAKGFLGTYAKFLGLDAAPLIEAYKKHAKADEYNPASIATPPIGRPPRGSAPSWTVWAGVALAMLIIGLSVASAFNGRAPQPAEPRTPRPAASATPTTARPSPSPSPSPTYEGVNVQLLAEGECWTRVAADGSPLAERTMTPGETAEYQGAETITIRFGDPSAVRVIVNGRDVGPVGERGRPVTVTFTRDGIAPAA